MELQRSEDQGLPERKGQKRKLEEEIQEDREISLPTGDARRALLAEVTAQVTLLESAFTWRESDRSAAKRATHVLAELAKNEEVVNVIVEGGAVPALVKHLQAPPCEDGDRSPKPFEHEVEKGSAFALGLLAVKPEHQQLIVDSGALSHLVNLLRRHKDSSISRAVISVIRRAADALTNLAHENSSIKTRVRFAKLCNCVAKTLKRLEEKIHGRVLNHLLYLMRVAEKPVQRRVALALAYLCSPDDQRTIFIDNNGLELLLGLLGSTSTKQQLDGAVALYKLSNKAMTLSPMDAAPPSPTPQVYLGEQYVNNATLSDVTFLVEGRRFYAHRICLLASSDAFRAMFDGGYREKDARDIEIPNIKWEVFELMMRFIYTGSVDVTLDIAQDLLRAADQYLLEGLKRLCEYTIAQDISLENVSSMYELSEAFHAISLRHTCILFILEHFDKLSARPGHLHLIQRIVPEIRNYFAKALTKPNPHKLRL
ncbi:hypothetical protein GOBAR_AA38896 [Gossypium barbadense]|uniref:BTB domain-containing protein n=1 Tax=Gossypium barbadense TaxID=3634 RepID=A0A2P5VSJ2_GOSBA|nr:hypothetical protein GOBAR_AA38896 [Gossypium barbadense]